MTYDYFIASRFRNKEIVLELAKKIRAAGKTVYAFIESKPSTEHVEKLEDSDTETAMQSFEAIPDWRNDSRVKDIFETDMTALKNSDALVLLLPAGKSAHMEAGTAYGLGKQTIVIGEQKETESLYLIFDEFYDSIDHFIASVS